MKRLLLSALIACLTAGAMAQFVHPGILNSEEELLRARQMVKEGRNPWKATYDKLESSPHTSLKWTPSPVEKVVRGGKTVWEPAPDNYPVAYRDAATAYQCAVMWWITKDKAYADDPALPTPAKVRCAEYLVQAGQTMLFSLLPRGGATVRFTPIDKKMAKSYTRYRNTNKL